MFELDDHYYMREALKEANYALSINEVPVGAVIVANNRIIARAHNQTELLNDSTAHAEILALTSAYHFLQAKYVPDCTLYVSLEPCVMCGGALYWSHIKKVVYGASDAKRGFSTISNKILHPKTEVVQGVMRKESEELLAEFFNRIRKQ